MELIPSFNMGVRERTMETAMCSALLVYYFNIHYHMA